MGQISPPPLKGCCAQGGETQPAQRNRVPKNVAVFGFGLLQTTEMKERRILEPPALGNCKVCALEIASSIIRSFAAEHASSPQLYRTAGHGPLFA